MRTGGFYTSFMDLIRRTSGGGQVQDQSSGWRLEIPAGPGGQYRWAQLDDYANLPRKDFLYHPPLRMTLSARVSENNLPGTWGFGFWNDPFSFSFLVSGAARRIPALPNAAWYFYAGQPNYLAFHDHHPAQGLLAASFSSLPIPTLLLAPGGLFAPLLLMRPLARLARRIARMMVKDEAGLVEADATRWHDYTLDWYEPGLRFSLDGQTVFENPVSPRGPLAFVLWIDNQYAAFPPNGKLQAGTSANPAPAWLEVQNLTVTKL
jgi:hypothetical protein